MYPGYISPSKKVFPWYTLSWKLRSITSISPHSLKDKKKDVVGANTKINCAIFMGSLMFTDISFNSLIFVNSFFYFFNKVVCVKWFIVEYWIINETCNLKAPFHLCFHFCLAFASSSLSSRYKEFMSAGRQFSKSTKPPTDKMLSLLCLYFIFVIFSGILMTSPKG